MPLRNSHWQTTASVCLVGLIALSVSWEMWLAPLRPGGSWLMLKCLPLLLPLMGILRGNRYTYQWSSLLIWLYVAEGASRTFTDSGLSRGLAGAELGLCLMFFCAAVQFVRSTPTTSSRPRDQ